MTLSRFGNSPPLISKRLLGNINNIWARHWVGFVNAGGVRTDYTSTQCAFMVAPCADFDEVRFLFKNIEASPPTVKMIAAVTNTSADRITPSVGNTKTNDPNTGYIDVTFSGSTTGTLPAFVSGDVRVPATYWSDWMRLPSIAPIDGQSTMPYLMWRTKFSSPFTYWNQGSTRTTINYPANFFDQYYSFGADRTVNPENATAANTTTFQDGTGVFAVEFRSSGRVVKTVCIGDSITQGVGDNSEGNSMGSWVPKSEMAALAAIIPINFLNYGQGGCPTVSYLAYGKQAVLDHKPAIAMYSVWSPNDGIPDAVNTVTAFNRAMEFASHCFDNDCLPILTFLAPNDGYVASPDAYRKALITRCKATKLAIIDMTPAVGDGASPERYKVGYKYDNTHPNAVGYSAMEAINMAELNNILRENFIW